MFIAFKTFIRRAAMAPLTVLAYGAVLIGLTWVTAVESVCSLRRMMGFEPKTHLPMRRDMPPAPPPIQTL
ncbi:MAG: hypothetical protein HOJ07_16405 [Rhodospirillaceae bacterium]|jgi:hypothetical protein|nr:hypothetical protein [Rhodospirillaceae bacterium]MBT3628769.1 hypothetical protein [Rhodospirillaceae bacterium]MBT3926717.1 hypothetical protein [Rhodospirillaceae bacterium]MBT4426828.1 hypothetical protein [Rhodospirillaceae bacterium]MBT5677274.1 hypothetical protein [Rhodospirillaceae bacterium]